MRARTAGVIGGALALVALTAGAAQAGHHQTHSTPPAGQHQPHSVASADDVSVDSGPYKPVGALNNPSPLG
ncbi:hypothetical protein ACWDZ4_16215 [Streptomyces sp. NPDC003016]